MMENPFRSVVQGRRKELRLTQAQLALRMKANKSTVVRVESRHNLPPARLWARLAEALAWSNDDLQRRVAANWLRQFGVSPGMPTCDDRPRAYQTGALLELDKRLDLNIARLPFQWWSVALSAWRSQLWANLGAIDSLLVTAEAQITTLENIFHALVGQMPQRSGRSRPASRKSKKNKASQRR